MNLREWALPVYTILIQLSSGALLSLWVMHTLIRPKVSAHQLDEIVRIPTSIIFFTILIAMIGAHFHLSKPHLSFLAVRNFQNSWLSREIVFTVLFFLMTGCLLALLWLVSGHQRLKDTLGWAAVLLGFATVYCMAQIYRLPTQMAWISPETVFFYLVEALLLGMVSLIVILIMDHSFSAERSLAGTDDRGPILEWGLKWLATAATLAAILVVGLSAYRIASLQLINEETARTSLRLLLGLYLPLLGLRFGLLISGMLWLLVSLRRLMRSGVAGRQFITPIYIATTFIVIAEILERFLFYATHVRIGI